MLNDILKAFGLNDEYQIQNFGTGLINHTWKVNNKDDAFILQRINSRVFPSPQHLADNINNVAAYLKQHYPGYLFVAPLPLPNGDNILHYENEYYRLMPFIKGSISIDAVQTADEAFEASKQFGRFSALLTGLDAGTLYYTLSDFHNLSLRYHQLEQAISSASKERLENSKDLIEKAQKHKDIADTYECIIKEKTIPLRIMHHDTKISNVLFGENRKGLCVIDLDTVMPGYFISDVGDMMRTYLSPCSEEERDMDKIRVRKEIFEAITNGYFSEMGGILTKAERGLFVYSGKFMIYMQAIRFLTDHLDNDVYYGAKYHDHNLVRAQNQFTLLERYIEMEIEFQGIVDRFGNAFN